MARPGQLGAGLNLSDRKEVPERDQYGTGTVLAVPSASPPEAAQSARLQTHHMGDVKEEERLKALINSLVLNWFDLF